MVYLREDALTAGAVNLVSTIAAAFQIIAKTLVLATLSSLARGILHAREGTRPKLGLPVAVLTHVLTAVNCVLAVAYLGVQLYYLYGYDGFGASLWLHANRLSAVPMILLFVGSVVALGASALVLIKVKNKFPTLKTVSDFQERFVWWGVTD